MKKNFLALDLEFDNEKIIQVGIAVGSNIDDIETFKWYVNPGHPISERITVLTGITQEDIDTKAVGLGVVAKELTDIIYRYGVFVNPVQWGGGDSHRLKNEFKECGIEFECFGHREIDVKTMFVFIQMARQGKTRSGLKNSMRKFNLEFKGEAHRADVDAYNTLVFYFHLRKRQFELEKLTIEK
jgi:inhibitor of KinA sporulation pathway (predicted exonuclease)